MDHSILFINTKIWKEIRLLFFVCRVFGASYLSDENQLRFRRFLKCYCTLIGVAQVAFLGFAASHVGSGPFLSDATFMILFTLAIQIGCFINWVCVLFTQFHFPELCAIFQELCNRGYQIQSKLRKVIYGGLCLVCLFIIVSGTMLTMSVSGVPGFPKIPSLLHHPVLDGLSSAFLSVQIRNYFQRKHDHLRI